MQIKRLSDVHCGKRVLHLFHAWYDIHFTMYLYNYIQCNLSIPNLAYSEILFNLNKLFGPKVFYHLLHAKLHCVFRILYIPNSEHKIKSLKYKIAYFDSL